MKKISSFLVLLLSIIFVFCSCAEVPNTNNTNATNSIQSNFESLPEGYIASVDDVPEFSGEPYVVIRDNEPEFKASDMVSESYEEYAQLDFLGRCGVVMACIGRDIMPIEDRGSIGQVKPTGWQTVKYDSVDGKYLYNRCHLIGFQLTGENANRQNLITGTRYLNTEGMLPFENMVADYVKETGNHVIYRVTPVFDGNNLLARGVQMEAKSVEDNGEGICFNIYAYNNQPDIEINYANGESRLLDSKTEESINQNTTQTVKYILNTSSKKFHSFTCRLVEDIKESNKQITTESRDTLINKGYSPCKGCNP